MTINDKIKDEKIKCHINREKAKISVLLSGKNDKYEYLTVNNSCRNITSWSK